MQLMHQAGRKRSQRNQLLAMQGFHLVGLQSMCHIAASTTVPRLRAAGKNHPELIAVKRMNSVSSVQTYGNCICDLARK